MWTILFLALLAPLDETRPAQRWTGHRLEHRWFGERDQDQFGKALATSGDFDGDGFRDIAIGAPTSDPATGKNAGSVHVYSGRDGRLLYSLHGSRGGDHFGQSLANIEDMDGDLIEDLLIGSPGEDGVAGPNSGAITLVSGVDGTTIRRWEGWSGGGLGGGFGRSVTTLDDLDQDGMTDILVGAYRHDVAGERVGMAAVLSSNGGGVLATWHGDVESDGFGYAVASLHDSLTGESFVVVSAPFATGEEGRLTGQVFVYSVASGQRLHTIEGTRPTALLGLEVTSVGDLDGDGTTDFACGAPHRDQPPYLNSGRIVVYSGANANLLWERLGQGDDREFGAAIAPCDDYDGDGHADLLVGAPGRSRKEDGWGYGSLSVLSGLTGNELYTVKGKSSRDRFGDALGSLGSGRIAIGAPVAENATLAEAGEVRLMTLEKR